VDLGIEGRCAVVGAASEGLGFETARALAEEGVRVLLVSRSRAKLDDALARLGPPASAHAADLASVEGAESAVLHALAALGRVDILVANVGGPPPGLARELDQDALRASLERCLLAMARLCQGVLPGMRERGWGRILAITSTGVRQPLARMVYSNAARAGLTGYLKTLAREVFADGVTVNSLLPANQVTQRLRSLVGAGFDQFVASLPGGRGGEPRDFGRIAAFLCSESAKYLTGVALAVDGGTDAGLI
jgi:3-oxoacyl-[acyl-carrier protein] reductase